MIHRKDHPVQRAIGVMLLGLGVILLWWVSHPSRLIAIDSPTFLFWHSAVEVFSVVVAILIFVTGYRAILSARKGAVVLLGVAFLGVGILDFLHLLSYTGMPDAVTENTRHKSIFFWLLARVLAASALLLYAWMPGGPDVGLWRRRLAVGLMLGGVVALGCLGLVWPDRIPALFVDGQGLTPLKIRLEWGIVLLNLITLFVLWHRRQALVRECLLALAFAVALSAESELFFTMLGVVDKDSANVLGHLYKVAAYLYLFHATFNEALSRPLERIEVQALREKMSLSAAPDGVLWIDSAGRILMANPAIERLTGYAGVELLGRDLAMLLPDAVRERHGEHLRAYFSDPKARAMGTMDLKLQQRDGQLVPVDISLGYWEDEGARYAIAYIRDLTERKKFEESLRHQATHDELTGLPNRRLFRLQLSQALARAGRTGSSVAVMVLDLDYFKKVNDSFGHAAGDALLVQVAQRMRATLREKDLLARLGGDEFAVLLSDLGTPEESVAVVKKLLISLEHAYRLQDQDIYSSGSLGVSFFPHDGRDSDTLMRFADMAMYHAKEAGRGSYSFYSKDMDLSVREDMMLHTRLKEAIAEARLQLHYQQQIDVRSGAVVGAEALLRWNDPVLGEVSPARFIPVAEATGLILPLSEWVLETACERIAQWCRAGTPLRVAVNFSAQQFRQRDLAERVSATLRRTGAQARWLEIEITESVAMSHPEQAREQLRALVALGCRVALDDFGTGYSSLGYLKALPVSTLKIDKSFMQGIPHDPDDVTIARAIMALAHSLGLSLVAEGVEAPEQLAFLREYGCECFQGWLHSKALDPETLTELLRQRIPQVLLDESH